MPETIYALSSGRPPAAIAVIRISGPQAHDAARALAGDLPEARSAAVRAIRDPGSGELLDEVLLLRFDRPSSATGEDVIELHCHGGRAIVSAVLGALGRHSGLREALPGEFTRRAFENGRIDLTEAEGLADLLEAETEVQRRAALRLADGTLKRQVARWQDRIVALSAVAEQAIDYADDDDDGRSVSPLAQEARDLADELREWVERPRIEPLKSGIRVVVAGPPNSGKSSLINAIAQTDRSIVSDLEGTTRDVVEVPVAIAGMPFLFADTAGLRETSDHVEAIGIDRARTEIDRGDLLLWLGAPSDIPKHRMAIAVRSKADLESVPDGRLAVSSLTGEGVGELISTVMEAARSLLPGEDAIALNQRQAEAIDEAQAALREAISAPDAAIQAEALRSARSAFDRLTGQAGIEDVLDALFSRFCLGK